MEEIIIVGFSENENANSAKEFQFNVEMEKNCKNDAKKIPIAPPIDAISNDSNKNAVRMLLRLKPKERSVPISTVLLATAAYMVIIAPIVAPKLKMTVIKIPSTLIKPARNSDCSAKYFCSIFGSNGSNLLSESKAFLNFS